MSRENHILLNYPEDPKKNVTVAVYEKWRDSQKRYEIAEFINQRLYRRYLKPFEFDHSTYVSEFKNGFSIMANCCLLIEAFESFYRGWGFSKSELAFLKFFTRVPQFSVFSQSDLPTQFYKHVRCGILHMGETTGGWRISREQRVPLISVSTKQINANKFMKQMKQSLNDYEMLLKSSDWKSPEWENVKKKMKAVLKNCG